MVTVARRPAGKGRCGSVDWTSPDEELRRSFRRRETPKFFRSDRKMTPAQPKAQALYRTPAWCAVARGASDAERDQSQALCVHGKAWAKNGGRPSGPISLGHPTGQPPGAVAHTQRAMQNGTSGLRARSEGLPCCREGVAPKPKNAVIPPPYRFRNQNGYNIAGLRGCHDRTQEPELR